MGNSRNKRHRKEQVRRVAEQRIKGTLEGFGVPDLLDQIPEACCMEELLTSWSAHCYLYTKNHKPKRLTGSRKKITTAQTLLFPSASPEHIAEEETRLSICLPPTYREFLEISNGLRLDSDCWLQPVEEVGYLRNIFPKIITQCLRLQKECEVESVSDSDYFKYGPEQNPNHIRYEYLEKCLLLNGNHTGKGNPLSKDNDLILLNTAVLFDNGEYEIWKYNSWHNARYESFADALRGLHKEWQNEIFEDLYPF